MKRIWLSLWLSQICQILCKINENVDFRNFDEKRMAELMAEPDLSDFVQKKENVHLGYFDEKHMAEPIAEPDLSDFVQHWWKYGF